MTTGKGTAPKDECRGREAIFLTDDQVDQMSDDQLARVTAYNENLERECHVVAPNPSGRAKAKAAVKKARR
ncbi:hypothetical protein [Xanthobacter aminoxidans]|uniref:hypothetical protein n=1 Tax=Xanthobacter aminoxidans TaxID=186280 RepID=UPI0020230728|nr:hypothetical protein [Xanthobacter aminoxidans]MCL8385666.1 hypothetical protein [Xanthobacter aminoxidans]